MIVIGVIGLIALGLAVNAPHLIEAYKQQQAASSVFQEYCAARLAHDCDRAFSFTGTKFQQATPFTEFVRQMHQLESDHGRLVAIRPQSFEVGKVGSPLQWTVVFESVERYEKADVRFVNKFQLENGSWKLYGYKRM